MVPERSAKLFRRKQVQKYDKFIKYANYSLFYGLILQKDLQI